MRPSECHPIGKSQPRDHEGRNNKVITLVIKELTFHMSPKSRSGCNAPVNVITLVNVPSLSSPNQTRQPTHRRWLTNFGLYKVN